MWPESRLHQHTGATDRAQEQEKAHQICVFSYESFGESANAHAYSTGN